MSVEIDNMNRGVHFALESENSSLRKEVCRFMLARSSRYRAVNELKTAFQGTLARVRCIHTERAMRSGGDRPVVHRERESSGGC